MAYFNDPRRQKWQTMFPRTLLIIGALLAVALSGCAGQTKATDRASGASGEVLAVETFMADIAQNVAGDRLRVASLLPVGADPHSFETTPGDIAKVARSNVIIVNGAGLEGPLSETIERAGGKGHIIVASAGLVPRHPHEEEALADHGDVDPHFWLDPNNVVKYVENIRDGLTSADPDGRAVYAANAQTYIERLKELDSWISEQVGQIPPERRQLVTNHESFGYFADRYGFKVIGTIFPGAGVEVGPSAQQVAHLVDRVKATGAKAIFLETGSNLQLAQQVARESGVKTVVQLYDHSITGSDGPAPNYIEMMKYDTKAIVDALK